MNDKHGRDRANSENVVSVKQDALLLGHGHRVSSEAVGVLRKSSHSGVVICVVRERLRHPESTVYFALNVDASWAAGSVAFVVADLAVVLAHAARQERARLAESIGS